jgi:hypothetical protein
MFSFVGRFHFDRAYTRPEADEMELMGEAPVQIHTSTDTPGRMQRPNRGQKKVIFPIRNYTQYLYYGKCCNYKT